VAVKETRARVKRKGEDWFEDRAKGEEKRKGDRS
jgi:hypothetical protein